MTMSRSKKRAMTRAHMKNMDESTKKAMSRAVSKAKSKAKAEFKKKLKMESLAKASTDIQKDKARGRALKHEKAVALKKAKAKLKANATPKAEPSVKIESIAEDVKIESKDQEDEIPATPETPTLNRDQKRMLLFLLSKKQVPLEEAMRQVQVLAMRRGEGSSSKEEQESDTPAPEAVAPVIEPILIREIISIPKIEKIIPPVVTVPDPEPPTPTPTIDETPEGRRVGLVAEKPITDSEEKLIKDAIVRTVRAKKSDCPPEFFGIKNRKGIIIATVADQESEDWLMTHRKDISKECGIKLKVYKEQDIPSPYVFKVTFPDSESESNESILDTLESYSRHPLPTSHWIVKKRIIEGHRVILDLSVDKKSAKYFEERNYRLPYGLGHATVEKADSKKTKHKEDDVDEEQTRPKKKKCKVESTDDQDQEYVFPIPTSYPIQQG